MQSESRHLLEQAVTGAALLSSHTLHQIIHVVCSKNFNNPTWKKCWTIIENLYASSPVDLITFALEAEKLYPNENRLLTHAASQAVNTIASTAHSYHHAYVLLEMDFSQKFYDRLYLIRNDHPLSARETESIMMHLSGKTEDVFLLLEKALAFYQKAEMEGEYEVLKEFEAGMLKRIGRIRQMAQVELAIEILNGVSELPDRHLQLTRLLKRGIISLCMTNALPPDFINDLVSITQ